MSVNVRCEGIAVRTYVYSDVIIERVKPLVYAIGQSYAPAESCAILMEYQASPATGASEIATVVYGQPQVAYVHGVAFGPAALLDVGTLMVVAVTIRAVLYAVLQLPVHGGSNDLRQ